MGIVLRSGRVCGVACTMLALGCYHGGTEGHDAADTGVGSEDERYIDDNAPDALAGPTDIEVEVRLE